MEIFPALESWERVMTGSSVGPQPRSQCFSFVYQDPGERQTQPPGDETNQKYFTKYKNISIPAVAAAQATPSLARHAKAVVQRLRGEAESLLDR